MIEFQYFDGCPNALVTLENLKELIDSQFTNEELFITEIKSSDDAEKLNFQGSPTILYEGLDIYTGQSPQSYNYSCRLYNIDNKFTGILSKAYIRKRIHELQN